MLCAFSWNKKKKLTFNLCSFLHLREHNSPHTEQHLAHKLRIRVKLCCCVCVYVSPATSLKWFALITYYDQEGIQMLWGLKLIQFLGPSLRKGMQNYEYKIRYESKCLFRTRKEITTNFKFKKLTNTTNNKNPEKWHNVFINELPDTPL